MYICSISLYISSYLHSSFQKLAHYDLYPHLILLDMEKGSINHVFGGRGNFSLYHQDAQEISAVVGFTL